MQLREVTGFGAYSRKDFSGLAEDFTVPGNRKSHGTVY
jgi:hypothetical protein